MLSGQATPSAQRSGCRTASVFGSTSQPISVSTDKASIVNASAQWASKTIRNAAARMAAFAKVLPKVSVACRSCGRASNPATIRPAPAFFSTSCDTCHLLRENSAVSASAKKKLAPAKIAIASAIAVSTRAG